MTGIKIIIQCVVLLGLTACIHYKDIHSNKKMASTAQFKSANSLPSQFNGHWPTSHWVTRYGDDQLNQLTHEALRNNPDLQAARARITEARAIAEYNTAAFQPNLGVNGEGGLGYLTTNVPLSSGMHGPWLNQGMLFTKLKYSLDIWGKHLASFRQSKAREYARMAASADAQLSIVAAVATLYNELEYEYALRDVLKRTITQRLALDQLTTMRLKTGLDTQTQHYQSRNTVANAQTQLAEVEGQMIVTKQRLAVLVGAGPDRAFTIQRPHLKNHDIPALPKHLPADLLGRRPDIVNARWQVEAASQGVQYAKAKFYPNIDLLGAAGIFIAGLDHVNLTGNTEILGPAVSLPIFDGGALRANLKERYAGYEEAVAVYNATLNRALSDIAEQLAAIHALDAQLRTEKEALQAAVRAYDIACKQYRIGLVSQLLVLNTETRLLEEQKKELQLISRRRDLDIALTKALGGGFKTSVLPDTLIKKSYGTTYAKYSISQ